MNRREFLKGTAWMGAAAFAAGCQLNRFGFGEGGQMQNFVYRKLMGKKIRVGFVGIGGRGTAEVRGGGLAVTVPEKLDFVWVKLD